MRLVVLEGEESLTHDRMIAAPVGQRFVVSPQARLITLLIVHRNDLHPQGHVLVEVSDFAVICQHLRQHPEDAPSLQLVHHFLVHYGGVGDEDRELVRSLTRAESDLRVARAFLHVEVLLVEKDKFGSDIAFWSTHDVLRVELVSSKEVIHDVPVDVVLSAVANRRHVSLRLHELVADTEVGSIWLSIVEGTLWLMVPVPFGPRLRVVLGLGSLDRARVRHDFLLRNQTFEVEGKFWVVPKDELLQLLRLFGVLLRHRIQLLLHLLLEKLHVKLFFWGSQALLGSVVLSDHIIVVRFDLFYLGDVLCML